MVMPSSGFREAHNDLTQCCIEVMEDKAVTSKYPGGLMAKDILDEIQVKHPGAFPLCTILDVCDEMNKIYPKD